MLLITTSTEAGIVGAGGANTSEFDVVPATVTVTVPAAAASGTWSCSWVPPACMTGAVVVPPPAVLNFTLLFDGVTISKPAPSNNIVSPGDGFPNMVANCTPQMVPATTTMRPALVWPPTPTVTGPHTASGGTVTVREPVAAAVTVPVVVPVAERKSTVFNEGVALKPSPVSVTLLPGVTLKNGDTPVTTRGVLVPVTVNGNSFPRRGTSCL